MTALTPKQRMLKDLARDLAAWERYAFGGTPEALDRAAFTLKWQEV